MKTLAVLPISTKNMLEESRVLTFIQRWAQTKTILQPAEMDGYSSENTSRAQTPLNTPDGSSTKLGPELDGDTSKPAVYRRLKIISENSLDSALSDASKASDGKEEEEEEDDDEEEEEASCAGLPDGKQGKADPVCEVADPTKGTMEDSVKEEKQEELEMDSSRQHPPQTEEVQEEMELDLEQEVEMKEGSSEGQTDEHEGPTVDRKEQGVGEEQLSQAVTEKAELEGDKSTIKVLEPESQTIQTDVVDLPPEQPSENMEAQAKTQEAEKPPPGSEEQPDESTTDAAPTSETPEASMPSEVIATPVEPSVIGTPSQDEEEGVSDVESERSQEPQLSSLDISGMAARLLESWKDLKVSSDEVTFKGKHCQTYKKKSVTIFQLVTFLHDIVF